MNTHNTLHFSTQCPVTCMIPAVMAYKSASYKTQPGGHLFQEATLALLGQMKCSFPGRLKAHQDCLCHRVTIAFLCLSPAPRAELPLKGRQLDLSPVPWHRRRAWR